MLRHYFNVHSMNSTQYGIEHESKLFFREPDSTTIRTGPMWPRHSYDIRQSVRPVWYKLHFLILTPAASTPAITQGLHTSPLLRVCRKHICLIETCIADWWLFFHVQIILVAYLLVRFRFILLDNAVQRYMWNPNNSLHKHCQQVAQLTQYDNDRIIHLLKTRFVII